ncbi:hypothetical protein NDU88_003087 [Pleurodeles waltl]|uniref:Uncharacterized protein n=1 Tax=Pleurodeles waltl TaxID=8319 RepID=A0AAV7MQS5_PLEWA|nr:hypothetical protein NDU88_003087 [Pleurodeles waltl]
MLGLAIRSPTIGLQEARDPHLGCGRPDAASSGEPEDGAMAQPASGPEACMDPTPADASFDSLFVGRNSSGALRPPDIMLHSSGRLF